MIAQSVLLAVYGQPPMLPKKELDPEVLLSARCMLKTLKRYVDVKPGKEGKLLSLVAATLQNVYNKGRE